MGDKVKIAVVDDHHLFRSGIIKLIESLSTSFKVVLEANNGKVFLDALKDSPEKPDIVLLDISMPILDGFKTAAILQKDYPELKTLVISMNDDELSLIRMLRMGVKGFIGKDIEPQSLKEAINTIIEGSYYHIQPDTDLKLSSHSVEAAYTDEITKKELIFLKMACSEDSYKDIAVSMCVSHRTVDGYRDSLFTKFDIKSRVGLVIFAFKYNLVELK